MGSNDKWSKRIYRYYTINWGGDKCREQKFAAEKGKRICGMWQLPFNGKILQTAKTQCDTFKKIGARAVMPSGITGIKKGEYRRMVIFNYILGCIKISHKQKTSKIRKNVTKSAFVRRCDTF